MKEVTLPSGAILKISESPFADSLALFESILREGKGVHLGGRDEVFDYVKAQICTLLPSKEVKSTLSVCMKRALYDGQMIGESTWEPVKARGDYIAACVAVTEENILPFGKSLYAVLSSIFQKLESIQK